MNNAHKSEKQSNPQPFGPVDQARYNLQQVAYSLDTYLESKGFRITKGARVEPEFILENSAFQLRLFRGCHNDSNNKSVPLSLTAIICLGENNLPETTYSYQLDKKHEEIPECVAHIRGFMATKFGYFNEEEIERHI